MLHVARSLQYVDEPEIIFQHAKNGLGRVQRNRVSFPQQIKSEHMIEIGIRQEHSGDGTIARSLRPRAQRRKSFDLRAEIRRCVDDKPNIAIRGNGDTRLSAGRNRSVTGQKTIPAGTIPLRQATTSGGS